MQPLEGTHRRPSQALPELAADCHMHVFGPLVTLASRYSGDRAQLVGEYERMLAPLGWHLQVFADARARHAILAVNPARLYRFDG